MPKEGIIPKKESYLKERNQPIRNQPKRKVITNKVNNQKVIILAK